ncbi:MAG: hypothetical protein ACRDVC_10155 [Acidimicrobiales bacterium]
MLPPQIRPHDATRSAGSGEARPSLIFVVVGAALIVAGGFVAAAGGEAPSKQLSWAAAYLVLVCGVAQLGLGGGRALMTPRQLNTKLIAWQFITFNLGNAGVLVGTLVGVLSLLYVGSAFLLLALALFARAARGTRERGWVFLYWAFILVLAVSVPVGAALGH